MSQQTTLYLMCMLLQCNLHATSTDPTDFFPHVEFSVVGHIGHWRQCVMVPCCHYDPNNFVYLQCTTVCSTWPTISNGRFQEMHHCFLLLLNAECLGYLILMHRADTLRFEFKDLFWGQFCHRESHHTPSTSCSEWVIPVIFWSENEPADSSLPHVMSAITSQWMVVMLLDVKQYSDSNNIHVPPWLLPAVLSTVMATWVGMCCSQ